MKKRLSTMLSVVALAAISGACAQSGGADATITTKIRSKLETDRIVTDPARIEVSTDEKIVTLSGTAQSPAVKEQAVKLARRTEGVRRVVDNLTLAPCAGASAAPEGAAASLQTGPARTQDAVITTAVKSKLSAERRVAANEIQVETREGVVTLSGTVKTQREKEEVLQIARGTEGVQRWRTGSWSRAPRTRRDRLRPLQDPHFQNTSERVVHSKSTPNPV